MIRRRVTILGATGSVGRSTLDLMDQAEQAGSGAFAVEVLTGAGNIALLAEQARRWRPRLVVTAEAERLGELKAAVAGLDVAVEAGPEAVVDAATRLVDWTMAAIVGAAGLRSAWAAAGTGATLALANKESLVSCGPALMARVTPEQAVAHPNWSMGAKISVDSATMANKGLEMIEAAYLFGLEAGRIDVVVHPESIIHSLVEMIDGSTLAQMGPPDMKTPIACALAWPERMAWPAPRLDLAALGALTFEAPDEVRFPALALARQALEAGGAAPAVFNAANEVGARAFLDHKLGFLNIAAVVAETMERLARADEAADAPDACDAALRIDALARRTAQRIVADHAQAA